MTMLQITLLQSFVMFVWAFIDNSQFENCSNLPSYWLISAHKLACLESLMRNRGKEVAAIFASPSFRCIALCAEQFLFTRKASHLFLSMADTRKVFFPLSTHCANFQCKLPSSYLRVTYLKCMALNAWKREVSTCVKTQTVQPGIVGVKVRAQVLLI